MTSLSQPENPFESEEITLLSPTYKLFLKPISRLSITVQLPNMSNSSSSNIAHSISSWEVMEKLRALIKPTEFSNLQVTKTSLEFFRFNGDFAKKVFTKKAMGQLNNHFIKLSGYMDNLKVRASECKSMFPKRHDWESFFRDAENMNEMLPGERPDTIFIDLLPIRWFSERDGFKTSEGGVVPSESIVRGVFEKFGVIRNIDIPLLSRGAPDKEESVSVGDFKKFNNIQGGLSFCAYIQYESFLGFVRCMDELRDMQLGHSDAILDYEAAVGSPKTARQGFKHIKFCEIKVDFDKTKHLSDASIERRRNLVIDAQRKKESHLRLIEEERLEAERLALQREIAKKERQMEKERRRLDREEKRRRKREREQKKMAKEEAKKRALLEERRSILGDRQLKSIRLFSFVIKRVRDRKSKELLQKWEKDLEESLQKHGQSAKAQDGRQKRKRKRHQRKEKEEEETLRRKLLLSLEKRMDVSS